MKIVLTGNIHKIVFILQKFTNYLNNSRKYPEDFKLVTTPFLNKNLAQMQQQKVGQKRSIKPSKLLF